MENEKYRGRFTRFYLMHSVGQSGGCTETAGKTGAAFSDRETFEMKAPSMIAAFEKHPETPAIERSSFRMLIG